MERSLFLILLLGACTADILKHLKRYRRDLEHHDLHIRDVTERSLEPYPDVLHLEVRSPDGETETLRLKRNSQFNTDLHVETSGDKKRHIFNDDKAEYISERAAFHVRAEFENDHIKRSFTGLLNKRGEKYFVQGDTDSIAVKLPPVSNPINMDLQPIDRELPATRNRMKYSRGEQFKESLTLRPSIMIVVDYGIYQKFTHNTDPIQVIKDYYSLVFAEFVRFYVQINYKGMTITPKLGKIYIITTQQEDNRIFGEFTKVNNTVGSHYGVLMGVHWFKETQRDYRQNKDIDHAMFFTDHDIYILEKNGYKAFSVLGVAFTGEICKYKSTSLTEDDFSFSAADHAAHEFGHNLGAHHDKGECEDGHYVMNPWASFGNDTTYPNHYKFSECSLKDIYNTVVRLNRQKRNCMADEPKVPQEIENLQIRIPGEQIDRNTQCERFIYEKGSKYCGHESTCRRMSCTRPKTGRCEVRSSRAALHGTPCGTGKHCVYGDCVPKA